MNLPLLVFGLVFPGAFLFGLGQILHLQAHNRFRSSWFWVSLGCLATVAAGAAGFLFAPVLVAWSGLEGVYAQRAFFLCIWLPAVAAAALVGGTLKMLGPVVRSPGGRLATIDSQEEHTSCACTACGFFIEQGDQICQCPTCGDHYHVTCWNAGGGCRNCAARGG